MRLRLPQRGPGHPAPPSGPPTHAGGPLVQGDAACAAPSRRTSAPRAPPPSLPQAALSKYGQPVDWVIMADSFTPADLPVPDETSEGGLLPPELRAWMQLLAAAGAIEQQLRTAVKESLGVSHDEFLVLCLLADEPGAALRMTRIAELLGRPKTRLTYQVACLQHADLVTRRPVCGDKRGVEVALTDKGHRLLRDVSPTLAAAMTRAVSEAVDHRQCRLLRGLLPQVPETER